MAKYTSGVIDLNTRILSEMAAFMPGCDAVVSLNSSAGKTLDALMVIALGSAALGAPFAYVIQGQRIFIDATDKTKIPYAALQTAIGT